MVDFEALTFVSSAEIIQANVTLIAGVMVLLTISVLTRQGKMGIMGDPIAFIAFSPILFVVSTGLALTSASSPASMQLFYGASIIAFMVGLIYLVIAIMVLAITIARNKD